MLFVEQERPQPPQLVAVVLRFDSQPFVCLLLSQSPNPALQAPVHRPPAHAVVVMLLFEQTTPQPPQFVVDVAVATSQPFVCLFPSQSAKPAVHAPAHTPFTQAAVTLFVEQTMP